MAKDRLEYSSVELDEDNLPKTQNIPIQRIGGPASSNGYSRSSLMESRVGLDKVSKYTFNMPYEADPVDWKAQHQTAGNQIAHGAGRLIGTTATKLLEGVGYLGALPEAIFKGDLTVAMNNSFSSTMSALEEDIKEALPIHHSRRYTEGNILQQMGELSFYMDDVVDGISFLASAVIGSKGISALGKGIGAYSRLGKAYSRLTKAAKTGQATELTRRLPNVAAVLQEMDLVTMTTFNSYVEAMFEGKDIYDQMLEQGATKERAAEAAVSTFKWNMAALMPSNHLTNSLIFRKAQPGMGRLARIKDPKTGKLVDEVRPLTRGEKFSVFGKGALQSVLSEGPYEENIQLAVQNYFDENSPKAFSSEAIGGVLGGMVNNFFTDEGQKSIMLGSIIGLIPGGVGGVKTAMAEKKNEKLIHTLLGQTFAGIENDPTLKDIYVKDDKGNIVTDSEGVPMKDPMKLAVYFAKQFNTDLNLLGTLLSNSTGNMIMEERFREQRLASLAYSMLFHPDALTHMGTELENLARLELESQLAEGEEVNEQELQEKTEQYKRKAFQYKTIYDNVMNVYGGLWNFKGEEGGAFKDMITAEQFHGAVDQMFWIQERNRLIAEKNRLESKQVKDPVTGEPLHVDPETGEPIPTVQQAIDVIDKTLPGIEEMIEASQSLYKDLLSEEKQQERYDKYVEQKRKADEAAAKKKKKDAEDAEKAAKRDAEPETKPEDQQPKQEAPEAAEGELLQEVKAEEESIKAAQTKEQRVKARKESVRRTLEEPVDTEITGAETARELRRKVYNKKYGERHGHPTLVNQNLKSAFEAVGEANIPVIYQSRVGEMYIDKETNEVIVREVETGKEHIITKVTNEEMYAGNYSSSQLGITPLKHTVFDFEFSQDGTSMFIQGTEYKVPVGRSLDDFIEEDDDGAPTAVTLEDYNGNTLRFTNPALVNEIAYALALVEEARHVASEKFLKEADTDFTVVRDPRFPTVEYYVYKVGEDWVVTKPNKQEVEVRGTKALDLGLTTVPEGKVKQRILEAFFSDLTALSERMYSNTIYETVKEEEALRKTIDKEIKNEIRTIVKHSRPATAKEALSAPTAAEVPTPKEAPKREGKKEQPKQVEEKEDTKEATEKAKKVEKDLVDKKTEEMAESQETKSETVAEDAEKATEQGIEPLNEEESVDREEDEQEDRSEWRGVRHTHSAAAVPAGYYEGNEYIPLNKLLSNIENENLSEYTLVAEIDYNYEPAEYDNFSWDKHKRTDGYVLSMTDRILKDNNGEDTFISFIDRIPIKLTMYDKEGNEVDVGGPLYLHQSGYDNIHVPAEVENSEAYIANEKRNTRRVRQEVIRSLAADQAVIFTTLEKGDGILNLNGEGSLPLHDVFTEDEIRNAKIGIAGGNGIIFTGGGSILGKGSPGNVFLQTETAAGNSYPLKLNISKVGLTEAKIILNAYRIAATSSGGFQTIYPVTDEIRTPVSGDLTVAEVINMLVLDGQITNQSNKTTNPIKQPHLIAKQLYYNSETGFLHYGTEKINLKKNIVPEEAEKFVKHLNEHKNIKIDRKLLGKKLDKSFRIGEIVGKKGQTYEQFLIYNNLLETSAIKDPETGTIFSKPVLIYDTSDYTDFLVSEGERTEAVKKTAEKRSKEPEQASKESAESLQAEKPKKEAVEFKNITDLHASPDGTVIYSDPGIFKEQIGILVTKGGYKTFLSTATDSEYRRRISQYDNMRITNPDFVNLFDKALLGERIVLERPAITEAAKVTLGEKKEEAPKKETPKRDRGNLASLGDEDAKFPRRRQYALEDYEQGDIEQAKAWLRAKFGKKATVKQVEDLINVATKHGNVEAFGLFTKDSITLSEKMEKGTEYHEAFHRVSLALLSPEQREAIYKDAEKRYGISDRTQLEETLAEEFREYMLNNNSIEFKGRQEFGEGNDLDLYNVMIDGKPATFSVPAGSSAEVVEQKKNETIRSFKPKIGERIKRFFQDLWDFIVTFFTGDLKIRELTVDNLFRVISKSSGITGRIRHSRINKESAEWLNNRYFLKHVAKGREFEHIPDPDTFNNLVDNLMYTMIRRSDVSSFRDIEKLDYNTPFRVMSERADLAYQYAADALQEGKVEESNGYRKLGDIYQEVVDNQDVFNEAMDDFLLRLGVKTVLPEDPESEDDIRGDNIERYGKAAFEQDTKDNTSSEIKFLIATLKTSEELDEVTSLYKFVDFDSMYDSLLNDLHDLRTIGEMEAAIAEKSEKKSDNYPYLDLLSKLNKSRTMNDFDSLRTKFFVSMRKNRNNMSNVSYKRKGQKYEMEAGNAETQSTAATYASSWGQDFLASDMFKDGKVDKDALSKVLSRFNRLSEAITGYYTDSNKTLKRYNEVFDEVIDLFHSVSIPLNSDVLESMLNEMLRDYPYANKEEALFRLVVDPSHRVSTFFSNKRGPFVTLMKEGVIKSGAGREIPLQNIYRNERLVRNTIGNHYTTVNNDEKVTMILGPDGNPYYLFSDNSFMTDLVNDMINDPNLFDLLRAVKYNKNSNWLDQLEDPEVRNKFKITVQSSFSQQDTGDRGRHIQNLSKVEERIAKLTLLGDGYIPLPTLADRKNLYSIFGLTPFNFRYRMNTVNNQVVYPTEAVDVIVGYMQDEINRIERTRREIDEAKKNRTEHLLFNNYHFKLNEDGSRNYKEANGLKFQHFTELNDRLSKVKGGTIEGTNLRQEAINILTERINDTLRDFESLGIIKGDIQKGRVVNIKNGLLDYKKVSKEAKDFFNGNEALAIKNILANYTMNGIMATVESEKIFFGDPAFYRDLDDKVKRYTAIASTGTNLRLDFQPNVQSGDPLIHDDNYRSAVIRTQLYNSKKLHADLVDKFTSIYMRQGMTKGEAADRAKSKTKAYTKVDQSDAQAYITPQMHRALKIRLGEWDEISEEAYELVMANKDKYTPEEQAKMDKLYMQPLKFVHFGHVYDFPGLAAPTYYKMSLATLTPQMVKDTQLQELYDRMQDSEDRIDMALFDTAVKAGIRDRSGILAEDATGNRFEDMVDVSEIEALRTFGIPFKDLRRGTVTDPKLETLTFVGTQLRKIVMSNIADDVEYVVGDRKLKGSELKDEYKLYIEHMSDEDKLNLFNKIGVDESTLETSDKQKELDFVIRRARASNMPDSFIEALSSQLDGVPMEYDALADRKWIQSMFISQMSKSTVDLHLPGTAMVQMSNFGLRSMTTDNSLQMFDKDGYMEAMVSIEVFKDEIPNYENLTYDERVATAKKLFKGLGYRIPTQGLNSVVPLKIVDFLPPYNTDTIVLPAEFTALTGSDFDIDKLYFVRYAYEEANGQLQPVPFMTAEKTTVKERMKKKAPEVLNEEIREIKEDYYKKLKEKFADRKDLQQDIDLAKEEMTGISALAEMFQDDYNTTENFIAAKSHLHTKFDRAKEVNDAIKDLVKERDAEIEKLINSWVSDSQKEFASWSIQKQNTKKANQNQIIDIMSAVLLTNHHFVDNMTPLDAPTSDIKNIADRINELEQNEREFPSLFSASPTYQSQVKDKYGGGKTGIGPFANSNVHHIFGQIAGLYLKANIGAGNTIEVDGKTYTDLSQVKGKDGENILDWLSALINAHVDIAKDPYIFTLNVNEQTYDTTALLIRAGVGNLTFPYLAQPILKEYAEVSSIKRGRIKPSKKSVRKTYENLYSDALKAEKKKRKDYTPGEIFDDKRLYKDIDVSAPRNSEFYARQLQIFDHYLELTKNAWFLREAVSASRIDTKRYGTSLMEIKAFNNLVLKVIDDDMIGNVKNTYLDTYLGKLYENSVLLAPTLFTDKSITSSRAISELHQHIIDEIGKRYDVSRDSKYYIRLIEDEIFAGISSRFFREMVGVTSEQLREMQIGENSIPARIVRTLKNNPEYAKNRFVKILNPVLSFRKNEPDTLGIFNATDSRTKWSKDRIIEAWGLLLNDPNEEVSRLAEDLVTYSFYTSGFSRRLHSFFNYIPPSYMKAIGYSDYFTEMKKRFNETGTDFIADIIHDDVYKNLWYNDDIVPFIPHGVTSGRVPFKDAKKDKIEYPAFFQIPANYTLDKGNVVIGKNEDGDLLFRPFIKTIISNNEYLYKYVGHVTDPQTNKTHGVYTVANKLGYAKSGKLLKEHGFDKSIMPENNVKTVEEDIIDRLDKFDAYADFNYVSPENRRVAQYMRQGLVEETQGETIPEVTDPVARIPQNLISGKESFGTKQEAKPEVKEALGENPHSIDMIIAGFRTRTTRSSSEILKYQEQKGDILQVGDFITQYGVSKDGTTKEVLTRITALHLKGTKNFLDTWDKEGWTEEGKEAIRRYKPGAVAIEFELVEQDPFQSDAEIEASGVTVKFSTEPQQVRDLMKELGVTKFMSFNPKAKTAAEEVRMEVPTDVMEKLYEKYAKCKVR